MNNFNNNGPPFPTPDELFSQILQSVMNTNVHNPSVIKSTTNTKSDGSRTQEVVEYANLDAFKYDRDLQHQQQIAAMNMQMQIMMTNTQSLLVNNNMQINAAIEAFKLSIVKELKLLSSGNNNKNNLELEYNNDDIIIYPDEEKGENMNQQEIILNESRDQIPIIQEEPIKQPIAEDNTNNLVDVTLDDFSEGTIDIPNIVKVKYDMNIDVRINENYDIEKDIIDTSNEEKSDSSNYSKNSLILINRHIIHKGFSQYYKDNIKWEAFDIPFNPDWKRLVGLSGGLTDGKLCIIRLISKEKNADYISIYLNGNDYSQALSQIKDERNRNQLYISYEAYQHPTFKYAYDALCYTYQLNNNKSFALIEQIADYRNDGSNLLISRNNPKTDLRIEYNIFRQTNKFVYTNYQPNIFIVEQTEDGGFLFSKRK